MAKQKNRGKQKTPSQMAMNKIMERRQTLEDQGTHALASQLLLMIGTKHDTLMEDEEVIPQILHYTGTIGLAQNFATELQADFIKQEGGTPRLISREEARAFLKSKLTGQDPDGSYNKFIDLLLAPKKDPAEVKKVAEAIAQERDSLSELMS